VQTRARRRSCGKVLLRKMRGHGGVDPVYATVISGWCRFGRIEDAAQVFDEMLAAGEGMLTVVIYNALIRGQANHGPREGEGVSMAWRIGKRSRGAKAVVGRDELGGDAVQPGTTSSLHLYGSRGGSNATRV
jgi:pentatricopeptide repeat protein